MKFLVYTRPRISAFFHALAEEMDIISEVKFCSDHKGLEEISLMDHMYQAMKDIDSGTPAPKDIPYDSIQKRCRYLRHEERGLAHRIINGMWLGIERICDEHNPDYFFGMVMDSYVLDIIDRVMRRRNSQYLGFVNNMINGYSRLTSRGELIRIREAGEQELNEVVSDLQRRTYMPSMQRDFMWSTSPLTMFFTKYLKEWAKVGYYEAAKLIKRDPYNFYYNSVAAKPNMTCRSIDQLWYRRFGSENWQQKIEDARRAGKTIIYFPLQFYPECSIDYWNNCLEMTAFEDVTDEVLSAAGHFDDIFIVMKEHPSASSYRKSRFYKKISEAGNCVLVDFDAISNDVIELSDIVLTWTGSVGVEAVVRDKPLITFGAAYYDPNGLFEQITAIKDIKNLSKLSTAAREGTSERTHEATINATVSYMLSGLVPGYVFPLDYGSRKNPSDPERMGTLANSLSQAIKALGGETYPVRDGCL